MKVKSLLVGATAFALVAAVPATTFAGFFPADRQTYTCGAARPDGTIPCEGADHVVFNSFINNPVVGDERPFLAGSINGANVQDTVKVKNGDIVTMRIYVHNNADPNKIGVAAATAKNVRVHVQLPTDSKAAQNVIGFISAQNPDGSSVTPINDTMMVVGDNALSMTYVAGSAKFEHKPNGVDTHIDAVDDSIVTNGGASLGGIKGCFEYSGYVTLQVKVAMAPTPKPPVTPPVVTPPVTPVVTTTPTSLPKTGAGDVAAVAAGASVVGAAMYRRFLSRRLAK